MRKQTGDEEGKQRKSLGILATVRFEYLKFPPRLEEFNCVTIRCTLAAPINCCLMWP
jgi:hypothetical protein